MEESDIIRRIKTLCEARSWTYYRLAKESGITYSTLCTMLHKVSAPSVPTLVKLCEGFGITLSQFFDEDQAQLLLTEEQRKHLKLWDTLSQKNQETAECFIRFLISEQNQ